MAVVLVSRQRSPVTSYCDMIIGLSLAQFDMCKYFVQLPKVIRICPMKSTTFNSSELPDEVLS